MNDSRLYYQIEEASFTDAEGRYGRILRFRFLPDEKEKTDITDTGLPSCTAEAVPAGTTVGIFLKEALHFSKRQISSLKYREDGIRVNGIMRRVTFVLKPGDLLEIVPKSAGSLYLDHGTFKEPPEILYEDGDLCIVNKPAGMACHPSPGHYADTLANQAAAYAAGKNENWTIRLIGRLDKDTSGIVIFAKNSEAAARLSEPSSVHKEYYALAEGRLPSEGNICLPIASDEHILGKMKIDPNGKPAETRYRTIAERSDFSFPNTSSLSEFREKSEENDAPMTCSLLQISLIHGRTHQIRLHLASLGHPLVGDALYGHGKKGETSAMLHCAKASLIQPFTGKPIRVFAPFPLIWKQYFVDAVPTCF